MLSLAEWSAISQIVAAAAVVASLLFVGFQVQHQTRATRAQTQQAITANFLVATQIFADHADAIQAGVESGDPAFADMTDAHRLSYLSAMYGLFKHYENMFLQYRSGMLSADEWQPWSQHILIYFHQPGVQTWWGMRRSSFMTDFAHFLDNSEKIGGPSPSDLQHDRA